MKHEYREGRIHETGGGPKVEPAVTAPVIIS